MKKKTQSIFLCMLLIVTIIVPTAVPTQIKQTTQLNYHPEEFIVQFTESAHQQITNQGTALQTGIPSLDTLNRIYNVQTITPTITSIITPKHTNLTQSLGLDRIYTFTVPATTNIPQVCTIYAQNPYVEYAEPNYAGHGCVTPNDASFSLQWGLHNTGQTGGTADADIDASEGWNLETGEGGVKIAIVDSGIEWSHPDLSSRIWINYNDPINGIDDDSNGFIDDYRGWDFVNSDNNPNDDHTISHGTHCAGIAGAATNNNIGVAGVDWNCKLIAIKAMQSNNVIFWNVAAPALIYAADMGADIISMSWSGSSPSDTLKNAVDYAYNAGCVMIAASGNSGTSSPYIPASYTNTIAVGATNHNDTRWPSSNKGNHLDLVAPGVDIYSTKRSNSYGYITGTSMSTPMVAGAAALLKAQDHTYSQERIRSILTLTTDDQVGDPAEDTPGFDIYHGHGRLNIFNALYGAPTKPSKPNGPPNGKAGEQYTYTTTAEDPNGEKLKYGWDWDSDDAVDEWDDNNGNYYPSGQQISTEHTWPEQGTYQIKVIAEDINGKQGLWSDPLSISMPKHFTLISEFPVLSWLISRSPNAFPLLRLLLNLSK
ncbi:MAG: S8 family serine peptidase [Candidatus Thermoplasmatota archaeon]|nr:S8 family serine peptidase [Candidatus Thermoplasmatota archaeon]MBU1940790.1 S8 family serine peptidase [Candidatus Thermoplasmatota archaeon]